MGDNYKRAKCGVYAIFNINNNKIYVGSSYRIHNRWGVHRYNLKNGTHHSIHLQRAWNKHQEDNFEFLILLECLKEDLLIWEQKFIDWLKPEYNISPTATNCLGVKGTPESNFKKSINHKFKGKLGKDNPFSKKYYQYNLDGSFIKEWNSSFEVERELGFNSANIRTYSKKKSTSYGYIWTREYLGIKIESRIKKDRTSTCKAVAQYTLDGQLVKIYKSQKEAYLELGKKSNANINEALKNNNKTAYGFKWRYTNDKTII